jgi:hypothetical protein
MTPVETRLDACCAEEQKVPQQRCGFRFNMTDKAKPLPEVSSFIPLSRGKGGGPPPPPPSSPPAIRPILRRHTWPARHPAPPNQVSRSVHFDSGKHVRYFWKAEQPIAVGIASSPPPAPASTDDDDDDKPRVLGVQLALARLNFPAEIIPLRRGGGVRPIELEGVWLTDDPCRLLAAVSVSNLGYRKDVVCRFTFDGWRTSSEVRGVYIGSDRQGYDRFMVTVYQASSCGGADLTGRLFELCFRYCVNGETFWDNNGGRNYQVLLHRAVMVCAAVRD